MEPDDGLDLGPFVAATRRELDRAARQHQRAGIPPAPPLPRRGPRLSLLVAAAVVLIGSAVVAATTADVLSSGLRASPSEAEHQAEPHGPALVSPRPPATVRPVSPVIEASQARVEIADPIAPGDATTAAEPTLDDDASASAGGDEGPAPAARSRSAMLAELQRLDAEAQRRWRAGDLEGAEALFLEIVEKGGRTRYAELAFGDLFTLASQTGDTRREHQRWRRYLVRFPRGRFADDVRAWLCRRASGDEATRCWQRYLVDWPEGTYRAEASRGVGPGESP